MEGGLFIAERNRGNGMEKKNDENKTQRKGHFRMVPQTPKQIKQNIILAIGLVFIAVGIILGACNFSAAESANLRPAIIVILVGALFLFFGLGFLRNSFIVFIGFMIFLLGIPVLLSTLEIIQLSPFKMVPYAMMSAGISLFLVGLYKFRRVRSSYTFISATLLVLGVFFWLFSTGILKFSLTTFVSRWLPLLILVLGVALVAVFYVQQILKKDFPYFEDEKDEILDEDSEK